MVHRNYYLCKIFIGLYVDFLYSFLKSKSEWLCTHIIETCYASEPIFNVSKQSMNFDKRKKYCLRNSFSSIIETSYTYESFHV